MAFTATIDKVMNFGNCMGVLYKILGDGSTTEVTTGMQQIYCAMLADNIDDDQALTDVIVSTTDPSVFDTAIDATKTAVGDGLYRRVLCIGTM